jgi:hypothetical protein
MALPEKKSTNNAYTPKRATVSIKDLDWTVCEQTKNLRLDVKKRITLGKLAATEVTSYDAELKENGDIILRPKVEIPAEELWLWKNKEAMASVQRGLEDLANGRFAELPEDYWDDIEE